MSLLPSTLILLVVSFLPPAAAQTDGTPHIDGGQNSKVAITGAIIGVVLVVLSLIAVGVYCVERCLHRRKMARFTPLPVQSEVGPYQYLSLPPPTRPAKGSRYGHGPYYPGSTSPPASPNARASSYGGGSPLPSPGAHSLRFDPYGHGPYYPGSTASPPASPNAQTSSPRASPLAQSFRQDSRSTLYSSSSSLISNDKSVTPQPSSASLRDVPPRANPPSRTLSHATTVTLIP
ncbi:hypothetical protein DFH09DRAFT_1277097 [Mycena vulgaris]|nr:hypothetical protein DFH09DRAFT_1277097 [Mycena vulgaris]